MDCCRAADEGVSTCPVNRQRGADRETNEREAEPQNQHTYRRVCSNLAIAPLFLMHLSAAGYGASASFTTPASMETLNDTKPISSTLGHLGF